MVLCNDPIGESIYSFAVVLNEENGKQAELGQLRSTETSRPLEKHSLYQVILEIIILYSDILCWISL